MNSRLLRGVSAADAAAALRVRHRPAGFFSADAWAGMTDLARAECIVAQLPERMEEAAQAVQKHVYSLTHHRDETVPAGAFLVEAMSAMAHEARLAWWVIRDAKEAKARAEDRAKREAKRAKVPA